MCVITPQQRVAHPLRMCVIKLQSALHILFGMFLNTVTEQLTQGKCLHYVYLTS